MWIRGFLALLCWVLWASPAWAAIVCSDAIEFNDATPTDPETVSYTTPAGSNQALFVGVTIRHSTVTIDSATHAGNAMTAVAVSAFTNPVSARMFYIVNPTSGTNNVVVQFSATQLADGIVIFTCSGVNTAAPIHDATNAAGTGTAVTVTVPNLVAGDVVVDMVGADAEASVAGEPTVGANQTAFHLGADGVEILWGSSQQAAADGGVMSWTIGTSDQWAIQAVAITAAAAPATILQSPPLPMILFQ